MTPPFVPVRLLARRAACLPLVLLLAVFLCTAPAHAAGRQPGVTLNFPDTEIEALSKVMADILSRPILLDPKVQGKLTLACEQGVTKAQAPPPRRARGPCSPDTDVGLTLRIRPQIGPNGAIRMSILQESSSVSSSTTPGTTNAGPTTNKRAIESTVVVNDGRIIVLGGLIEDSYTSDADQWPVLGDIPLLGGLFRTLGRTRARRPTCWSFLRPVVMPDEESTTALSLDRYDMIRARQRALPADVHHILPDDTDMPLAPAPAGGT